MGYHVSYTMNIIKAVLCKAMPGWQFSTVKYVYKLAQTYFNMLHIVKTIF